jgi:hypothetical protein
MTTAHDIDWPQLLAERLTTTHPDVLRELLATFIHTLMGAEADALCGAGYGHAAASALTPATATGIANSTPAPAHWVWRSQAAAGLLLPGLAARTPNGR